MKLAVSAALIACALMISGCAGIRWTDKPEPIKVRAYIDGSDELKVQGDKVWYVHHEFNKPGKERGADEPTYINGVAWKPAWNGDTSEPYVIAKPLPRKPMQNVRLNDVNARGNVTITGYPSKSNDYTLTVKFDDNAQNSAAWYDVTIEFE